MVDSVGDSILFVHHRDISTPVGTTVPYYVSNRMTDSHSVHVICRKQPQERGETSDYGATLHDIDTGDVAVLSPIAFHVLATVYAVIFALRYRFDVVYCFQSSMIQGWLAARLGGSRLVVGLQSVPVRQRRDFQSVTGLRPTARTRVATALLSAYSALVGAILRDSSDVICLTEGIAEVTEDAYGIDLSDARVLGMGVDVEAFAVDRQAEEDEGKEWTVTYVGHLSETRGLEHVLEAIAASDHDVTIRIAGDGPEDYTEELAESAERLGVSDRVERLGLIPHEEVPRLLAASDFSISPLPDIESYRVSFPAKLLEYLAAGTRVIATDIPPHRTLIDDGTNGYLYDGGRDGLVETIDQAIEDDRRGDVERRARQTAERYDWDVVADRYAAVLFDSSESVSETRPAREQKTASRRVG